MHGEYELNTTLVMTCVKPTHVNCYGEYELNTAPFTTVVNHLLVIVMGNMSLILQI